MTTPKKTSKSYVAAPYEAVDVAEWVAWARAYEMPGLGKSKRLAKLAKKHGAKVKQVRLVKPRWADLRGLADIAASHPGRPFNIFLDEIPPVSEEEREAVEGYSK